MQGTNYIDAFWITISKQQSWSIIESLCATKIESTVELDRLKDSLFENYITEIIAEMLNI